VTASLNEASLDSQCAREHFKRVKPKSVVYLFSGGKDSSLAQLLTRDLVRELASEMKYDVYVLYVRVPGNTHPRNAEAARRVAEWHYREYGFKPMYREAPFDFWDLAAKYGLQKGAGRWCFIMFKDRVFRSVERELPRPQLHIDGMSPEDSSRRSEMIKRELEFVETADRTKFWAWHPLYKLGLSEEEKLELLRRHKELEPLVELYEESGDSLNCVVCPYRPKKELLRIHAVEDLTNVYYLARRCLRSEKWLKYFEALLNRPLTRFLT